MGKLSAYLYVLSHFRTIINGVKASKYLYSVGLLYTLEGLNLIEFLKQPRTKVEIINKLGEVSDFDLFEQLIDVIVKYYGKNVNDKIAIDEKKVSKIKRYAKHPFVKQYDKMLEASRELYPENLLALLQKREPKFDWSELLVTFYAQLRAPIYYMGREVLFRFADLGKHLKGKTLLEVGGGFGYETEHILKYFKGDIKIIVADFFKEVLDIARIHEVNINGKQIPLEELDNVEFVLLDPDFKEPWPIEYQSVDGVFAYAVLHWTRYPRDFVLECGRVLRNGGLFVGATPLYKEQPSGIEVILSKIIGSRGFLLKEEFESYLRDAGFREVEVLLSAGFKAIK